MNILIGCETSGQIRHAFRQRRHNAFSCDLLPADDDSCQHWRGDVRDAIVEPERMMAEMKCGSRFSRWDLIILHPPCTCLCCSGNAHYGRGKPKHAERLQAIDWTMALWELAKVHADQVCMENPQGVLPIKPAQYIQPYQFGHNESKKTGLWLHDLEPLRPTKFVPMPLCGHRENQTPSGQNRLGPSADRWKLRSKTYSGIAAAMAQQWGLTQAVASSAVNS